REALCLRLGLHTVERFALAGRVAPAVFAVLAEAVVLLGDRLDLFGDEALHGVEERTGLLGHRQVVELATEVVGVQRIGGHVVPFMSRSSPLPHHARIRWRLPNGRESVAPWPSS